jgi:Glycosyl transferase family 2
MSASGPGSDHRSDGTRGSHERADGLRELALRLDSLEAHSQQRHLELRGELSTALRALELLHDDDQRARRRLRQLRESVGYDAAFDQPDPRVSVVIPTWDSVDTLVGRALPSALNQTHTNLEVLVIGDASPPEIGQAVSALGDPRVTFRNLTLRGPYEEDRYRAWLASGTPGFNAGVALAGGLWIAPLGDDDEFEPDHIERLLAAAQSRRLEFVYSQGRVLLPDGRETTLGEFPPRLTQIGLQSAVYHAGLSFMELELGHALFGKPNDWGLVHRMMRVGVRMGMIDQTTVVYRPSLRAQTPPPAQPEGRASRVTELERELRDERAQTHDLRRRLEEVRRSRSWRLTAPLRRLRAAMRKT